MLSELTLGADKNGLRFNSPFYRYVLGNTAELRRRSVQATVLSVRLSVRSSRWFVPCVHVRRRPSFQTWGGGGGGSDCIYLCALYIENLPVELNCVDETKKRRDIQKNLVWFHYLSSVVHGKLCSVGFVLNSRRSKFWHIAIVLLLLLIHFFFFFFFFFLS